MPGDVPHPQTVLRGHRGEVQALDFDNSERFLVSGDSLGEVRVWCLDDLRPAAIRRLHPLTGGILSLRLFKSGAQQLLGTQGRDGTTLLWGCDEDLRLSKEPVRSFVRDCYSFCRFSVLHGQPVVSVKGQQVEQEQQDELQLAADFAASVLADDADSGVASPNTNGTACVAANDSLDPVAQPQQVEQEQQQEQQQQGGQAECDSFSAEQHASAGAAIWALHACKQASEQHPPALLAMPGSDERTAEVVCCSCGRQVAEFREEAAGKKLGMLMSVQLYCLPQTPTAPTSSPAAPSICLAAGYEDGSVVVWQLGAPPLSPPLAQRQLCTDPVMALAIDSACTGGTAGSAEDQVVLFRVDHAAGKLSVRVAIKLQRKGIGDVAVRPDRKLLATAGWDGRVRVYKYRNGRPLAILKYHTSAVTGICFAPRSMLLATAARDGTVALWPLFQPDQ
ncbi:hypothetical protein D9Q98_008725 [Chlorella vulgaris]|uniref:Uncharacterized protein n=1 Tax=Chlorella vulgaris TaxID=3077 RepID=A0A9D4TIJ8_CHLVU|nr:hypothetical protein D9Q98_008725 [Chlorella vulgaris]